MSDRQKDWVLYTIFAALGLSPIAALFLWGPDNEVLGYISQVATIVVVLALGLKLLTGRKRNSNQKRR